MLIKKIRLFLYKACEYYQSTYNVYFPLNHRAHSGFLENRVVLLVTGRGALGGVGRWERM